jgi:hypothetical protein
MLSLEPIIDFVREDKENVDLRLLISARNKWAHAAPAPLSDRLKLDGALDRLLGVVEGVCIVVVTSVQSGHTIAKTLAGVSGLFGGRSMTLDRSLQELLSAADCPQLIALPAHGMPVLLCPYLAFEIGRAGENRVKLLTRINAGTREYLDPVNAVDSASQPDQ